MNRTNHIRCLVSLFITSFAFFSCKKESETDKILNQITGKWPHQNMHIRSFYLQTGLLHSDVIHQTLAGDFYEFTKDGFLYRRSFGFNRDTLNFSILNSGQVAFIKGLWRDTLSIVKLTKEELTLQSKYTDTANGLRSDINYNFKK
jgi:hypothetical protein